MTQLCASCGRTISTAPCVHCGQDPLLNARYTLLEVRGRGAQGTTYKAQDTQTDSVVAIKEIPLGSSVPGSVLQRCEREASVLRQLRHPGIPRYHDHFVSGTGRFSTFVLVQEYIDGPDLEEQAESHRFTEAEVLAILQELLEIVGGLHALSPPVLHRDLKPKNVLVGPDRLYIVDFGAVRDVVSESGGSSVVGTFGYMAPEQLVGDAGPPSDLYALGAIAIFLLTRQDPTTLANRQGHLRWRPLANVSDGFAVAIDAMVDPDPERRPKSASEASTLLSSPDQASFRPRAALDVRPPPQLPAIRRRATLVAWGSFDGELPARAHGQAADLIERHLGLTGTVAVLGSSLRWQSADHRRRIEVRVMNQDGQTHVWVAERIDGLAGGLYGGIGGGVGGGFGGGFAAGAYMLGGPLFAGAWVVSMVAGSLLLAHVLYRRTRATRQQEVEAAAAELTRSLSALI